MTEALLTNLLWIKNHVLAEEAKQEDQADNEPQN